MKVMILSDFAPPIWGGAENYVVNLGSRLNKLGHEVHWVTSRLPNTLKFENLDGINIHRFPIMFSDHQFFPGRQTYPFTTLLPAIKLAKKMDIVQSNTLVAGFLGWFVAKYAGKPSLLFCHEFYGKNWQTFGQNIFEKFAYPFFEMIMANAPYDWFACPSEYSKQTLMEYGVKTDKISVIPHGIDIEKFVDEQDNYKIEYNLKGPLIGYIGRLNISGSGQGKNLLTLLKTIKLISERNPDAKLILAGSGFENLVPLINKLEIQKNVLYLGKIPYDATVKFYKTCDVVVCPALSDGFCFLLAEAGASGIPTVATNLGSHPERIQNNETGILSNPTPEDLAQNITSIISDKSLSMKFSENSKNYSKKFTWDKSVDEHINLYTKLIQEKK